MKIEINPKDYRRLLMMLSISDWVLNAHLTENPTGFRRKCGEVVERFLRHAKAMDCGDFVEELEGGELAISDALDKEPGVRDAILDYDSETFWTDLVSRLAERDYEKIHGRPAVPFEGDPDFVETDEESFARLDEIDKLEQVYWKEFEANGVENLHILRGMGHPS